MKSKSIGNSAVNLCNVMQHQHSNLVGNVHGGEIMKMMDNTAGLVAYKHSHASRAVTARVSEIEFLQPIHIGNLVTSKGRLIYTGNSSMEIKVEVWVEDIRNNQPGTKAATAYFTMVALNNDGKPIKVPEIEIYNDEEQLLYQEGKQRYESRNRNK
ncbi:MAG: acyl-CoA thioesterase [Tindallia sp. MSAO_Bac2]|nr:MAG: acyl-CoA thioesterase [Tindallia sp. MSAO_Bac2]